MGSDPENANLLITVKDQGMGISEDVKQMIQNSDWTLLEHTRLSLYTCCRVIHHLKGELQVEPNTPTGTIFTVRFPFVYRLTSLNDETIYYEQFRNWQHILTSGTNRITETDARFDPQAQAN